MFGVFFASFSCGRHIVCVCWLLMRCILLFWSRCDAAVSLFNSLSLSLASSRCLCPSISIAHSHIACVLRCLVDLLYFWLFSCVFPIHATLHVHIKLRPRDVEIHFVCALHSNVCSKCASPFSIHRRSIHLGRFANGSVIGFPSNVTSDTHTHADTMPLLLRLSKCCRLVYVAIYHFKFTCDADLLFDRCFSYTTNGSHRYQSRARSLSLFLDPFQYNYICTAAYHIRTQIIIHCVFDILHFFLCGSFSTVFCSHWFGEKQDKATTQRSSAFSEKCT